MELPVASTLRLAGTRFADVRAVARTGSTNLDVLELGRAGEAEGIVVVADAQTAGRGRRGRTWQAAPGDALLVSVLLRPPAAVAGLVTAALALAADDAVMAAGVDARSVGIKWPNDLVAIGASGAPERETADARGSTTVVPARKLAGILAEAEWPARSNISAGWRAPAPGERALVAAGIGINLHWPPPPTGATGTSPGNRRTSAPGTAADTGHATHASDPEVPLGDAASAADSEVALRAVSLDELRGASTVGADVLVDLLVALEARYAALVADGPAALLADWRARCTTLGRQVRVDLGAEDVAGRAVDITDDGHLVVDTLEGGRRTLAVGDVVHLR